MTTESTSQPVGTEAPVRTEAVVATASEMTVGTMKMAKVGERRVVVIRTKDGFHALDNACPHQGYGLTTGSLDGDLLTCQWHNWKFRVSDGSCVIGQEGVACHDVRVDGDDVVVGVTEPTDADKRDALWPSLLRGIERDYRGQIARDTARLLDAGATPEQILAVGIQHGLPRTEWGMGHDMAVAADLLHLSKRYDGIEKTLPLAQALSGFAESNRDRALHEVPAAQPVEANQATFINAIENEDASGAVNTIRALLDSEQPDVIDEAKRWFIDAISRHHYNYGHGAIYTQKAFALAEQVPEMAELLLTELALTLVYGTREDTLPYMRTADRAIDQVDLVQLAKAPSFRTTGWTDAGDTVLDALLDSPSAPIDALVQAALDGAGVEGLINIVTLAASKRLLRYDLAIERDAHEEFSWLDISHALTYSNAARWAWQVDPGPRAARLVLLTAFLAFDSGRAERRINRIDLDLPQPAHGDLFRAVIEQRIDDAVAIALGGEPEQTATELEAAGLEDTAGSFIVMAHLVKTAVAAREEAEATGSRLPLAAAARFLASHRAERFVTVGAREAIDFVRTGRPPTR